VAEFFISRPWRRRGIGQEAVRLIPTASLAAGTSWSTLRNPQAVAFWARWWAEYTAGQFQERTENGEIHQYFESGVRRSH